MSESFFLDKPLVDGEDCMPSMVRRSSSLERERAMDEWDYVLVLPRLNFGLGDMGSSYLASLQDLGFEMIAYISYDGESIFVLIRCPLHKLQEHAAKMNFKLILDEFVLEDLALKGDDSAGISPVRISHEPDITPYRPFEMIYGRYSKGIPDALYFRPAGDEHPFTELVRLKIISVMIETPSLNPRFINIKSSITAGSISAFFPLHNAAARKRLEENNSINGNWRNVQPWQQPFDDIMQYFGQKIALYFVFLGHYSEWLVIPAILSIPVEIVIAVTRDPSSPAAAGYGALVTLWSACLLEYWRQREACVMMKWGTYKFNEIEPDRPEFVGSVSASHINGKPHFYFPPRLRREYVRQSYAILVLMMCIVITLIIAVVVTQYYLSEVAGKDSADYMSSILQSILIIVADEVYGHVAVATTLRENHRTDSEYENSLIIKTFLFSFVNNYFSFFYLAFVAPPLGDCPNHDRCMWPLAYQIFVVFLSRIFWSIISDDVIPYLRQRLVLQAIEKKSKGTLDLLTRPELEEKLDTFHVINESISRYNDLVIQFGFGAMFVSALPAATLMSLVACAWTGRAYAFRLFNLVQRPAPKATESIGTWQSVLEVMIVMSVCTNGAIITFTMDNPENSRFVSQKAKFWFFILYQWICLLLIFLLRLYVSDFPEQIAIQLERQKFLGSKIIDKVPDLDSKQSQNATAPTVWSTDVEIDIHPSNYHIDFSDPPTDPRKQ